MQFVDWHGVTDRGYLFVTVALIDKKRAHIK